MKFAKNLLIYADGRIVESKDALVGMHLYQHERADDGSWWERIFDIEHARLIDPKNPERTLAVTAVALERSFEMKFTAEEVAQQNAEQRARTMRAVLWGIANYPGDDADKEQ